MSRTPTLALLAALLAAPASHAQTLDPGGYDLEAYGAPQGYPLPHGAPIAPGNIVAFYTSYDQVRPLRPVPTAPPVSPLRRAPAPLTLHWTHAGTQTDLEDYLARNPVTALLVARGSPDGGATILYEHYRYARTDQDRFLSQSMAKTLTGMLVGIALHEGRIRSIDDPASAYVPELAGTQYGATPLRALLHMSSGVQFLETYKPGDDNEKLGRALLPRNAPGAVAAVRQFDTRTAEPGARFYYSGAETEVLGLVVARATGVSLSDYLSTRIWAPMGMAAPAAWATDPTGQEVAFCCLVARLQDWARLGLMVADGGRWNGRQIVPADWIVDSTAVPPGSPSAPGRTPGAAGYGYQIWLLPGPRRAVSFRGVHGQRIFIDPASRLVLVQTAVFPDATGPGLAEIGQLWQALLAQEAPNPGASP